MKLLTLAIAATLVASPAFADSTSSASLGPMTMQLFDLDPSDGVTPSITFLPFVPPYSGSITFAAASFYDPFSAPTGQSQRNYAATPWNPVAASQSTLVAGAAASLTGSTPFNPNNALLSASGRSITPVSANPDLAVGYDAHVGFAGQSNFTLSANTMMTLSATAAVSAWAQAGNSALHHHDEAFASVVLAISGPGPSGGGGQYTVGQLDILLQLFAGDGPQSFSDSKNFGLSFVNLTSGNLTGGIEADVYVSGSSPSTPLPLPVPEPEAYAMLLAGLGLLGFVARWRKAK